MKNSVVVDAAKFRAALEVAVTERKSTIPILTSICLQPVAGALQLRSTDLDLSAITDLDGLADNETPFMLPHRKVLDLLKSESGVLTIAWNPTMETVKVAPEKDETLETAEPCTDEDAVTIEVTREAASGGWITLEVGGLTYDLPTLPATNFPQLPEVEPPAFHVSGLN